MDNIAPNWHLKNHYCNYKTGKKNTYGYAVRAGILKNLHKESVYYFYRCLCNIRIVRIHTAITIR